MYLDGESIRGIRKWLNENRIETPKGAKQWGESVVLGILKNEKYKGDVLLQKSYTVDYLTKTTAKNKGEVAQYYIENNHEGIVSREVFDMVQNEIQRRASLYSSKNPSKYSSKYALTGKVICGECGAAYRRVTWSRNGKKTIVWRCIERLNNRTRRSSTILEESLHNAVLNGIGYVMRSTNDVKKTVKREIELAIFKDDECNEQGIKHKIRKREKELNILKKILKESEDKEFYSGKIKFIESQLIELNDKLKNTTSPNNTIINRMEKFIDSTELDMNECFNQLIRILIESVTIISENEVKIKYAGGTEMEVVLNA